MKKVLYLIFFSFFSIEGFAQSILQNPSFETSNGSGGALHWSGGDNKIQTAETTFDGQYAYHLLPSEGSYSWQAIPEDSIQEDKEYIVTAYTKSIGVEPTGQVYWRYVSDGPLQRSAFLLNPCDTGWIKHSWTFTPASATNARIDIYFDYGEGAFYIDQVSMELNTDTAFNYQAYQEPSFPPSDKWNSTQLNQFASDIVKNIYKNHVVRDPNRKIYGMTYEFLKSGNQTQEFGLDAMHDGFWWIEAMLSAHLAFPDLNYYDCVCKYQIPFYANLLNNSDVIFPEMEHRPEQSLPYINGPIKGWIPRGWDDGMGYDLGGSPLPNAYYTCSNHLIQDVANGLLYAYMFKEEDRIADAMTHVFEHIDNYSFFYIPYVLYPQGVVADDELLLAGNYIPVDLNLEASPIYSGAYLEMPKEILAYNDGLAWNYTQGVSEAVRLNQSFKPEQAYGIIYQALSTVDAMEIFFDSHKYQYGLFDFPAYNAVWETGTGKLEQYFSNTPEYFTSPLLGTRGISHVKILAGLLPVLKENPDLWASYYEELQAAGDQRFIVNIWDETPLLDGIEDALFEEATTFTVGSTAVKMVSDPQNLNLFVNTQESTVSIDFMPADTANFGQAIHINLTNLGDISIVNSEGDSLHFAYAFQGGSSHTFEISIPLVHHPEQKHWTATPEFSRHQLFLEGTAFPLLFMSTSERIITRIEHIILGTIDTWHKEFLRVGYIPDGTTVPPGMTPSWNISETGGTAAFLEVIALWEIYQKESTIWEALIDNKNKLYHEFNLPDSVLESLNLPASGQSVIDSIIYKGTRNRVNLNDSLSDISQINTDFYEGTEALQIHFENENLQKLSFHDCHSYSLNFYEFDYLEFAGKASYPVNLTMQLVDETGNESALFQLEFSEDYQLFQLDLNNLNNPDFDLSKVDYARLFTEGNSNLILFLDKIELTNSVLTHVKETQHILPVLISPNPGRSVIAISNLDHLSIPSEICLYDPNGRLLFCQILKNKVSKIDLDVSALVNGVYFLEIKSANRKQVEKIILLD